MFQDKKKKLSIKFAATELALPAQGEASNIFALTNRLITANDVSYDLKYTLIFKSHFYQLFKNFTQCILIIFTPQLIPD